MWHPGEKKHGKDEMACNMKKGRKSCRLFISFCKMKLFVRKKNCFIWDSNTGPRHHNSSALTVPL